MMYTCIFTRMSYQNSVWINITARCSYSTFQPVSKVHRSAQTYTNIAPALSTCILAVHISELNTSNIAFGWYHTYVLISI